MKTMQELLNVCNKVRGSIVGRCDYTEHSIGSTKDLKDRYYDEETGFLWVFAPDMGPDLKTDRLPLPIQPRKDSE